MNCCMRVMRVTIVSSTACCAALVLFLHTLWSESAGSHVDAAAGGAWRHSSSRQLLQQGPGLCDQNVPGIPLNWQPDDKVLALTFDDGPHSSSLLAVLDVLKAHAVPATFFVNTYTASDWLGPFSSPANQAALKRLVAEGHELGSHAAEHLRLSQLPTAEAQKQIEWAIGNISSVTGSKAVPLFRAPYGNGFVTEMTQPPSAAVRQLWDVARQHHVHIAWSFSGEDYMIGGTDPGCSDRLFNAYGPPLVYTGTTGVVLMHSTPNAMGGCPQALQRLISYYKTAGYKFVKVSQLVEQLYKMSPAAVVDRARACPQRQSERSAGTAARPFFGRLR